jgi:uncharacterized protein (TIGR00255 family)
MSVYSMTGFALVSAGPAPENGAANDSSARSASSLSVEIRSVNSRFLDIAFRLPDELRTAEPALRDLLSTALRRGKVELRAGLGRGSESGLPEPTPELLHQLARIESTVLGWNRQAQPLSVNDIMHWCRSAPASAPADEALLDMTRRCIKELKAARAREGAKLAEILMQRVHTLRELASKAAPLVGAVVKRQQERFVERWNDALAQVGAQAGGAGTLPADAVRERALSEAAAYALRIDVAEELARLDAHLSEIERLLKAGGEVGKRLEFLIQELQREANTLGSKSAATELSAISVEMKVAVEQMREQVQNIE